MTKRRAPLTFHLALTQIAALIGWDNAAAIVGKREGTVRNWSDPDTSAAITLDDALALDVAYQEAGGDGAPFWQCYSTRLEADTARALFSTDAILEAGATAAKESGDAIAAVMQAARPGACDGTKAIAIRELEESIAAQTNTLAKLRAGRSSDVRADPAGVAGRAGSVPGEGK
ncbi:hypothetical protein [Sphingosinicella sp. CPCC 101087]|uniref:hypothetical protein n=1 Tax=Sphingosinicella sp. CPCC 101087 TaxID=2497754 RepID=UPI00101C5F7B|nr:hypothetical protein [Sphingosinicella sp. CPCC 101087]